MPPKKYTSLLRGRGQFLPLNSSPLQGGAPSHYPSFPRGQDTGKRINHFNILSPHSNPPRKGERELLGWQTEV